MPCNLHVRRLWLLFAVVLLMPSLKAESAQLARRRSASPASVPLNPGGAPKPQLLNADTDPALRFPVAVWETAVTRGWLDVRRNNITYTVVESKRKSKSSVGKKLMSEGLVRYLAEPVRASAEDDFDVSRSEIKDIRLEKTYVRISFARTLPFIIYLPQEQWETVQNSRQFMSASKLYMAGTMAIHRAIQNFDSVLAEVKPPSLDVSLRADPSSVEKGHPVTLIWNSTNATSLEIQPGVGHVPATGGISVTPQESTTYVLTATGPAGTKVATASVAVTQPAPAALPTLVLTQPSVGDGQSVEVATTPLVIHGVVMDASGIPVVTINGRPVTMRPTSAQAAQFSSDPLNLQPGENLFVITAVNSAHGQAKLSFVARLTAAPPKPQPAVPANPRGLSKAEIISLLQGEVPSARVAELIKERGIKFAPTPGDLQDIRSAGGGADVIDAINQAPR